MSSGPSIDPQRRSPALLPVWPCPQPPVAFLTSDLSPQTSVFRFPVSRFSPLIRFLPKAHRLPRRLNRPCRSHPAAPFSFLLSPSRANARASFTLPQPRARLAFTLPEQRGRHAFTLIEMLVVIGIIVLLMVLVVPAFNSLKGAGDITNAAYTVKGVLEQARTYAKANNTYTWVGFYEEDGSVPSTSPATPGSGRLVMSIVASKDGAQGFRPDSAVSGTNFFDITKVVQVGKLVKIENVHLPLFASGTGTGDTFDTRPVPDSNAFTGTNDSRFGEINAATVTAPTTNSKFPFQYPVGNPTPPTQYAFKKALQFSPRGECRINSTFDVRRIVEVGLLQTRANATPVPSGGAGTSAVTFAGNIVAVQITGFGSNVKIYRR